jgi:membrane associated rhomboid family serine protease
MAHLGGFISGLFLGVIIPEPVEKNSQNKLAKITCTILMLVFILICVLLFSIKH